MLTYSKSPTYIKPSFSRGGTAELLLDKMNDLRPDHHCFKERLPAFNFSARRLFITCLHSLMVAIHVLRICLNLCQSRRSPVLLGRLFYVSKVGRSGE